MSDVKYLEPDFVAKQKTKQSRTQTASKDNFDYDLEAKYYNDSVKSKNIPETTENVEKPTHDEKSNPVDEVSFITKHKTIIIVVAAICIVLLICLAYWYFSKPVVDPALVMTRYKESLDNVPDPDMTNLAGNIKSQPTPAIPVQKPIQKPIQKQEQKQEPEFDPKSVPENDIISHEKLVTTVDDNELDRFINPESNNSRSTVEDDDQDDQDDQDNDLEDIDNSE